jgi:hypothetical protein
MPSLIELVERVNRGGDIPAEALETYQQSDNGAERFLAYHAGATLGLRRSHESLAEALAAIGYADRKVLEQYVGLCAFLGREAEATKPIVKFGETAVLRGELSLGLEAASSAAAQDLGRGGAWSRERHNLEMLCGIYQAAADATAFDAGDAAWSNTQPNVAYVVTALGDDEPAARSAATVAAHIDRKDWRLKVYATEAFVRRDGQQWAEWGGSGATAGRIGRSPDAAASAPAASTWINGGIGAVPSRARGQAVIDRIRNAGASTWIAPTGGDLLSAARALAAQLVEDQTDVLILDADITDPIAGLLIGWKVAKRILWISRRRPAYSENIDAVCYLDPAQADADRDWWDTRGVEPHVLLEGVDTKTELDHPTPDRRQYGIPESAVICATAADDLTRRIGDEMVDQAITLLRKQPQAVYLLIGAGDTTALRRRFDAAGVGKRVGYAGRRRDLAAFLKMTDLYLCPFDGSDASPSSPQETIAAMGAGLPILAWPDGSGVGDPAGADALAEDADGWIAQACRYVRDAAARRRAGSEMRRRVEQHFTSDTTAKALEAIVSKLAEAGDSFADDSLRIAA